MKFRGLRRVTHQYALVNCYTSKSYHELPRALLCTSACPGSRVDTSKSWFQIPPPVSTWIYKLTKSGEPLIANLPVGLLCKLWIESRLESSLGTLPTFQCTCLKTHLQVQCLKHAWTIVCMCRLAAFIAHWAAVALWLQTTNHGEWFEEKMRQRWARTPPLFVRDDGKSN